MKRLTRAFIVFTLVRHVKGEGLTPAEAGSAVVYAPLVGLCLGLGLMALDALLAPYLESEILAAAQALALIILTGAVHLDELQKTFDATSATSAPSAPAFTAVRVYGLLAVMLVVFFKIRAIEVIGEGRPFTLLVIPVIARWAGLLFLYGGRRPGDGVAAVVEQIKAWHLLVMTALVLGITAYGLKLPGLWAALWISLFSLLSRTALQRYHREFRQHHLGAVIELSEALGFVLITVL